MLLTDAEIVKKLNIKPTERILDIGGSMTQHNTIQVDTLVDLIRPEDAPYCPTALKAKNFIKVDITKEKLPFKDKEFDICLCTHTLEDLPNPPFVIEEMSRVAKRGLIVTPSMGEDMKFGHIDYTDWLTGAMRMPGQAHHKWFFINSDNELEITPKIYPILYTSNFQITGWTGEKEMVYTWSGKIKYEEFVSLNIHKLIDRYEGFLKSNKKYIRRSVAVVFLDNPWNMLKAYIKLVVRRGNGYKYRSNMQ